MKIEKRGNSYRVRKTINKKTHTLLFDHKPTQREIQDQINQITQEGSVRKGTFKTCAEEYLKVKKNVLSPSTYRSYDSILRNMPAYFLDIEIMDMTAYDVQNYINNHAQTHSAKTTHNVHGFISAVLSLFRPKLELSTTLPQKAKNEPYIPTDEEVKILLEHTRNTRYYIPFCLACLGLRQSEITGLTIDDLSDDNFLTINKAKVYGSDGYVTKLPKTEDSTRQVYVPADLADMIRKQGYIYEGHPRRLLDYLSESQKRLGIEHFRFHDFRHYFASMCHNELGMSDESIKKLGGWKSTSTVMTNVYRHSMQNSVSQAQDDVAKKLSGIF